MLTEDDIKRALEVLHTSDKTRDLSITLDDERSLTRVYLRNLQALGAIVKDAKGIEILMIASVLFTQNKFSHIAHIMQVMAYKYLCHDCAGIGVVINNDGEYHTCPKCKGHGIAEFRD